MSQRRELGDYPADFEPYFLRWNSVLWTPNPENLEAAKNEMFEYRGEQGVMPAHQHKACMKLVRAADKYPPRVCPHCQSDTLKEQKEIEASEEEKVLWLP